MAAATSHANEPDRPNPNRGTPDRFTAEIVTRLVQPGSCVSCLYCHETIDFVAGGGRSQVTRKLYANGKLHHVELFHPECYEAQTGH